MSSDLCKVCGFQPTMRKEPRDSWVNLNLRKYRLRMQCGCKSKDLFIDINSPNEYSQEYKKLWEAWIRREEDYALASEYEIRLEILK